MVERARGWRLCGLGISPEKWDGLVSWMLHVNSYVL